MKIRGGCFTEHMIGGDRKYIICTETSRDIFIFKKVSHKVVAAYLTVQQSVYVPGYD